MRKWVLQVQEIDDLEEHLSDDFFFFSSKADKCYTTAPYTKESMLIFGSEDSGLPPEFFQRWPERFYRIPMRPGARCLNLACSTAVVLYEALRQATFETMK